MTEFAEEVLRLVFSRGMYGLQTSMGREESEDSLPSSEDLWASLPPDERRDLLKSRARPSRAR